MIDTPSVDWLALSPTLALLAVAGGDAARCRARTAGGRAGVLDRRLRRGLRRVRGAGRLGLRPLARADGGRGRVDDPRPARRAGGDPDRARRARGRAALGGRRAPLARRRVLRAPRRRERRDGLLRLRGEPDDDVPGARVVLDRSLRAVRARHAPARVARGGPQVPHHRELRLGDPAVRLRARLRCDRRARVHGDPRGDGSRRSALRDRDGDDPRGARVQGLRRAVPHVDAGRVPGRADHGDGLHVRRDEDRRPRAHAPGSRHGVPGAGRDLVGRGRGARRLLARDRQLRRDRPART